MTNYPKISIVTPTYNHAKHLEKTIRSVINQAYPNLEYIIIDGGSDDGSVEIIKQYADQLAHWESEKDQGMYHALQKGFELATGDIMGWINSDDLHHPGSLHTLAQIFTDFPQITWLQGYTNHIDEQDRIVFATSVTEIDKLFFYQRKHLSTGKFIQQESTFWRRSLWEKAGSYISTDYKYAGDFELWMRFFRHGQLYNVSAFLGSFRVSRSGQASRDHYQTYVQETETILTLNPITYSEKVQILGRKVNDFVKYKSMSLKRLTKKLFGLNHRSVINDVLTFDYKTQMYKTKDRKTL